ncbi:hypothetical protein [uncultured Algimonas sp.]|uniref:hypothetical protein n=1 Tax=uncultured Algimonas sp. TaxID=1547920 RepID=UPI00261735E4|nr:hypothetical protein [uncultured Algimonas sp.]
MFQPYYVKSVYLKRVIYFIVLAVAIVIPLALGAVPFQDPLGWVSVVGIVLMMFLCMQLLSDIISKLTGFTFFLSLFGMIILFFVSAALITVLAPAYLAYNLIQYFRASEV